MSRVLPAVRAVFALAITVAGIAWAADLFRLVGWNFLAEQFLAAVLTAALAYVFLSREAGPRWYDMALAASAIVSGTWLTLDYPNLLNDFFNPPPEGRVVAWVLCLLIIEGVRRTAGWGLVCVVLAFAVYAMVGHMVDGDLQTREVELEQMVFYLSVDTSGVFGIVLLIAVTVVIPFVLFGQLLGASGGAQFFNDLSLALMGRFRGGPAKISVLASSLFGSINGIVVSNILATGVITIPMMKKGGFRADQAAAIEASSSNGGQLMPPVMGAVAFLMADFLQVGYAEVAIAALLPSLLYYLALFAQVDLEAAKAQILGVPAAEIPRLVKVAAAGWLFGLPFVVLIYALFWLHREPQNAALWACGTVAVIGFAVGYGGSRLTLRQAWTCLLETGRASTGIILIAAAAGLIMGILQVTGLGFALTLALVSLGAGSILLLLVIAALLCIVLGMGMPTLGVYVLLAVLVAPSLVEVGITPLAAHMFILYLGMMSFVTPPVAIAAFFAANLAGARPMRTGWVAMRMSWTAYIVPFLFVFSPTLLMQGDTVDVVVAFATAAAGVWFVSSGMIGYGMRPLGWLSRTASLVGGALLLLPPGAVSRAVEANLAGAVLATAVVTAEILQRRRALVQKARQQQ